MKLIPLTQGKFAKVDDADFEWLSQWKWHYATTGYAQRNLQAKPKHKMISMHTLIMETPKGREVDHINRDKLDNRRVNLRIVTRSINSHNKPAQSNNTTGHKGVYWAAYTNRYRVLIKINGTQIHVGYFKNLSDAIRARKAIEIERGLCV
jgi:hypothetical protein